MTVGVYLLLTTVTAAFLLIDPQFAAYTLPLCQRRATTRTLG